jgi:hypothetical protein
MAGTPEVPRFFRAAGGIDVDKADVDRCRAFVDENAEVGNPSSRHWHRVFDLFRLTV